MVKIAFCMVVRNDTDILKNNLVYQYNIGFRDFYILHHMATVEQTQNLQNIADLLNKNGCNVWITSHNKAEHYHDKDIKILTDKARSDGFEWIMGCDADEFIRLKKHNTIQELIAEYDYLNGAELRFNWYEHRPLFNVFEPANAFIEFNYRDKERREQHKAIGKFNKKMFYCAGVHLIHHALVTINIDSDVAYYSHFPDRNILQFVEKYKIQYVNWLERYKQFSLSEDMDNDPLFLYKFWETKIVKDYSDKVIDQVEEKYFEI